MKKSKAFTLIEMLVTIFILVIMLGVATVSISAGKGSSTVTTQAEEIIGLVDELKSFAYGPERERAAHYVLIIKTTNIPSTEDFCNKDSGIANKLTKNQYMICETNDKDISSFTVPGNLNDKFSRVRAGGLNQDMAITSTFSPVNPIVINIRTYDGQIGYDLRYCDKDSACLNPSIKLDQTGISKTLTLNSILGTFQ